MEPIDVEEIEDEGGPTEKPKKKTKAKKKVEKKDPIAHYVLDFIVERKTLDDLASSIRDGRYKE